MRQTIGLFVVVVFLTAALSGCGFIASRLPRVRIEPPPAQQQKQPSEQSTTEANAAPDSVAAGARAGEKGEPADPGSATETATPTADTQPTPQAQDETPVASKPAPAPSAPRAMGSSGGGARYVPLGAKRALTTADLSGRSAWELDILRNEIYAAHGRPFARADLRRYFRSKSWYHEDSGFTEARLSALEKRNADFIARYQKGRGVTSGSSGSGRRTSGGSGGFVLPFSSSRAVTYNDLYPLSNWQLDVARNEIYARHGRPFKRADLRNYFRSKSWYHEDPGFTEGRLSALEKRNAELIRRYQR
ncbi:YARHG domain-containing protein [bacterium]|nr:YARHG domain-containing protein [bacterium]